MILISLFSEILRDSLLFCFLSFDSRLKKVLIQLLHVVQYTFSFLSFLNSNHTYVRNLFLFFRLNIKKPRRSLPPTPPTTPAPSSVSSVNLERFRGPPPHSFYMTSYISSFSASGSGYLTPNERSASICMDWDNFPFKVCENKR